MHVLCRLSSCCLISYLLYRADALKWNSKIQIDHSEHLHCSSLGTKKLDLNKYASLPFLCSPQKRFMNSTKDYQKSILDGICVELILMNFGEIFYFLDTLKYAHDRVVEYQIKLSPYRFSFKRRSEKSGDIRGSLVPIIGTLGQKLKSICLEYHTRQCMIVSSGLKLATSRNEPTKLWEGNVSSRVCLSTGGPM